MTFKMNSRYPLFLFSDETVLLNLNFYKIKKCFSRVLKSRKSLANKIFEYDIYADCIWR